MLFAGYAAENVEKNVAKDLGGNTGGPNPPSGRKLKEVVTGQRAQYATYFHWQSRQANATLIDKRPASSAWLNDCSHGGLGNQICYMPFSC